MKIKQITNHYLPQKGGQEIYVENLCALLSKRNIENYVIQPYVKRCPKKENVIMVPILPKLNKLVKDGDFFGLNLSLGFLKKILFEENDIIISHYHFHYPVIRKYKRVVIVSHGINWGKNICCLADRYRMHALRLVKRDNVYLVANDTHFLRFLGYNIKPASNFFKRIDERVWFIPNCIDLKSFSVNTDKNIHREKIIFVPRNIRYARGIHLAIKSFAIFLGKYKEYKMHIAGGPLKGEYYNYCLDLIKRFGIEGNVCFLGRLNRENIRQKYYHSKVTLIPTIEREGTSYAALESMACRTPVVSTNVAGLKDLPTVKSSLTPYDINRKIQRVLLSWDKVSKDQYSQIKDNFNVDKWTKAWGHVIKQVGGV